MLIIPLLTSDEAADVLRRASQLDFVDGRATARGSAQQAKSNEQARRSGEAYDEVSASVLAALEGSPAVRDIAFPRRFTRPLVNRYGVGASYGMHVDGAFMGSGDTAVRTDLSYTLFLSPPSEYEGGELQVAGDSGMSRVRADPGTLALYPTHSLHQVTAVTAGARICAVGWIESWIPDPRYRALMTKVRQVQGDLERDRASALTRLTMNEVAEGLLRYGAR